MSSIVMIFNDLTLFTKNKSTYTHLTYVQSYTVHSVTDISTFPSIFYTYAIVLGLKYILL